MKILRTITVMATAFVMWSLTQSANAITTSACNAIAGSTINGGICYVADTNFFTWATHETAANALGLNLASIHSAAQNLVVKGIGGAIFSFWIGFNDMASEGVFVWTDGSP